jgi:hypothetical protein
VSILNRFAKKEQTVRWALGAIKCRAYSFNPRVRARLVIDDP